MIAPSRDPRFGSYPEHRSLHRHAYPRPTSTTDNGAYVGTESSPPAHPAQRPRQAMPHAEDQGCSVMTLHIGLPMNRQKQQRCLSF